MNPRPCAPDGVEWALRPATSQVPNGYCPIHATGVTLPEGFAVTPLQYVE